MSACQNSEELRHYGAQALPLENPFQHGRMTTRLLESLRVVYVSNTMLEQDMWRNRQVNSPIENVWFARIQLLWGLRWPLCDDERASNTRFCGAIIACVTGRPPKPTPAPTPTPTPTFGGMPPTGPEEGTVRAALASRQERDGLFVMMWAQRILSNWLGLQSGRDSWLNC
ncbi:hypothetical protein BJV77DRAFT_965461 [Russula vinacea]|nr:hypothetical protein BJV77DRAFT_965461 [Russula vinacea]